MGKLKDAWNLIHNPLTNKDFNGFCDTAGNSYTTNTMYYLYFSLIAQNLFKWNNLPKTMNAEFLEKTLFLQGRACAVYDKITNEIYNLQYSEISQPNMYELPTKIDAHSLTYNKTFEESDFVICRNNKMYIPTAIFADYFAGIVQDIDQTLRVNLKAQKTPIAFTGDKEQKNVVQNLQMKYDSNNPYLFFQKGYDDLFNIECFKTDAPFIADKLTEMKKDYKNEFLTFLGVNNVDTEKKERLISDEVNANNQNLSLNFEAMFEARRNFCEEFNEKFKEYITEPISVEPAIKPISINENNINNGGGENGTIFNES